MEKVIYRPETIANWSELAANKFGPLVARTYRENDWSGVDFKEVAIETIGSDVVFALEERGQVVAFTAVKYLPEIGDGVIYIREIIVDERYRGQGLSRTLRSWMQAVLQPQAVLGVANNPVSVISRASLFDRLGYETYWGNEPVGNYPQPRSQTELDRLGQKFVQVAMPEHTSVYEAGIAPYSEMVIWTPQPEPGLEPRLKAVLERTRQFEAKIGGPAMATLFSLKSDFEVK